MLVFKFGGASVKDASAVKNVAQIISMFPNKKKLIVVSAMGKTTNLLEDVVEALWTNNYESYRYLVDQVYKYHQKIVDDLFIERHEGLISFLVDICDVLREKINKTKSENYDFEYDYAQCYYYDNYYEYYYYEYYYLCHCYEYFYFEYYYYFNYY